MTDWTTYLDSVFEEYSRWWDDFTATDVERSPLDLKVEEVRPPRSLSVKEKRGERLGVLAGLRKYAKERVLLVGVPGSGKSAALRRLALALAQEAKEGCSDCIPVVVELRYGDNSLFELILDSFWRHDLGLVLDEKVLEQGLRQGRFWLLVDGLNELPSGELRSQLQHLMKHYPRTWMTVTTRDVGSGGLSAIEKQLTIQPLTEEQMRTFIRKQQQGERILQQLGSCLRELEKTPMFLWMLCKMLQVTGDRPRNAGELLNQFVLHEYERGLKQDISVGDLRECWQDLLEELAFAMMPRKERLSIRLVFSRQEAEIILEQFLEQKGERDRLGRVKGWLEGLLAHHLLQVESEERLAFHHQLIQEYYAAMRLKRMMSGLTDDVLQRDYLNLFEWTEAIALMLGLLDDEEQAVRVVQLALAVDWQLGARLAGEVKREFQDKTVVLVSGLDVPLPVKIELWGMTRSDEAVEFITPTLKDKNLLLRRGAAEVLGSIGSEAAVEALIAASQDEETLIRWGHKYWMRMRWIIADALGRISSEAGAEALISALQHKDSVVHNSAAIALGNIGSDTAVDAFISILQSQNLRQHRVAAIILGNIGSEAAVEALVSTLQDEDFGVRKSAAEALAKIGSETAVEGLVSALKDEDFRVCRCAAEMLGRMGFEVGVETLIFTLQGEDIWVREDVVEALGNIGSETAVEALMSVLEDEDAVVRSKVVEALGSIGSEMVVEFLISALKDEDAVVRQNAAEALGSIGSETAVEFLISALKDEDAVVRQNAAEALGSIGSETAVEFLISALKDEDAVVRQSVVKALGSIGLESAVEVLIATLQHNDFSVRQNVVEALGSIGSESAVEVLIAILQHDDFSVRESAVKALGNIGSESVVEALIVSLQYNSLAVRESAAVVLGKIARLTDLPQLLNILQDTENLFLLDTIAAVQTRAKCYNYPNSAATDAISQLQEQNTNEEQ